MSKGHEVGNSRRGGSRPGAGPPAGNTNALKHSGEGAIKALQRGDDLRGLAASLEQQTRNELELHGRAAIVTKNATRLQAISELFFGLILGALETGNVDDVDRFTRRWGWLCNSAIRAWREVAQNETDDGRTLDYEAVLAAKRAKAEEGAE